jgi:hypothetical protein
MGTLTYRGGKPRGYLGLAGTCRWCGGKLRHTDGRNGGYQGNGHFCSIRCGYQWAVERLGRP